VGKGTIQKHQKTETGEEDVNVFDTDEVLNTVSCMHNEIQTYQTSQLHHVPSCKSSHARLSHAIQNKQMTCISASHCLVHVINKTAGNDRFLFTHTVNNEQALNCMAHMQFLFAAQNQLPATMTVNHLVDIPMSQVGCETEHPHAGLIHPGLIHGRCASQCVGTDVTHKQ